jgi:hypothetical protein
MVKHVVLIVWKKSFHPKYICYKFCVTSHGYFVMNYVFCQTIEPL